MTATASQPESLPFSRPVRTLYGVGPERAAQLSRLGISTIEDLLLHRPNRYEDRRNFRPIAELEQCESMITRGKVVARGVKWFRQHSKSIFEMVLTDGTARLHCRWWNLPYLEEYYSPGDEVVVFGKVLRLKPRTMDHPETEVVQTGDDDFIHLSRVTPVYPLTEGLPQRWLRSLIYRTVQQLGSQIPEPWAASFLPAGNPLPTRAKALEMLHSPQSEQEPDLARRRLALDEFVQLQVQMRQRRKRFEMKARGLPCGGDNRLMKPFLARIGFKLTGAQTRVLRDLRKDLSGERPMRRLLQGDVGSGKTLVAGCCALMALESGFSVALMAPTEVLAEQHFQNFSRWYTRLRIPVELRTGTFKLSAQGESQNSGRGDSQKAGAAPSPCMHIGTHALLNQNLELPGLGLVIIDEQHKFGVTQREELVRKGAYPHLLVMTATPIPRSLGLTVYGDLDVSVLDELPPGRGRIQTFVRTAESLPKVWAFLKQQLGAGRQAYIVYPRVDDSGPAQTKAVVQEFEKLRQVLSPFKLGLLHGRLRPQEKETVMAGFRSGQIHIVLSTSLIEVGVDVANATVMVIENAEQFGLAQLHQLRGRIGRGAANSYCVLVSAAKTREARQRLQILERTTDGFEIAEADLRLRGPGDLLGQEQSGLPKFRFGDLASDWDLLQLARIVSAQIVEASSGENAG